MSNEKKISKIKIEEGIRISLEKSTKHLDAAEVLISNNLLDNAVASIEFAIEEFGRAVYLRERLQRGSETIERALETDHWLKYNKAFSLLLTDIKIIWENTISWFPENYFPKGYWQIRKETISPFTRLNAIFTYIDEKAQTWHNGINADGKN